MIVMLCLLLATRVIAQSGIYSCVSIERRGVEWYLQLCVDRASFLR